MDKVLLSEENRLIRSFIEGNERSLGKLILMHKAKVYSYILFKVKHTDLAEDIFQETFIKVIRTLKSGKYNEEGKFLPWIIRISHNLVIDHYRKQKKRNEQYATESFQVLDILPSDEINEEDRLGKKQMFKSVKGYVKQLPAEQREVLMMRMYFDMSFKEISNLTGVSINTSLGRMRYALINLRKKIEEKEAKSYARIGA